MTTIVGYYQHVPKLIDYFDHVYKPPKLYERLGSERFIGVATQSFSNVEYGATYDKGLKCLHWWTKTKCNLTGLSQLLYAARGTGVRLWVGSDA